MISDDHCWITLPFNADCAVDDDDQWLNVEVTDPKVLEAPHMAKWLYAGGRGVACSAAQLVLVLVGGLMPEEVKNSAAADQETQHEGPLGVQLPSFCHLVHMSLLAEMDARAAAAAKAAQQLLSFRVQTFADPSSPAGLAWLHMAADLQHLVPVSRKRKSKNP
eukprot:gene7877-8073_t